MSKKISAILGGWMQTGDPDPKVTAAPDLIDENIAFIYEQ